MSQNSSKDFIETAGRSFRCVTLAGFGAMEGTAGCNLHPFLRLLFNASCLFSDDIVECLLGKIVVCNLLLLSIEYFF